MVIPVQFQATPLKPQILYLSILKYRYTDVTTKGDQGRTTRSIIIMLWKWDEKGPVLIINIQKLDSPWIAE